MDYKLGYIDEDDAQVKKFERALRKKGFSVIGYNITKGMPIQTLLEKAYESDIDLLMIDYYLKDKGILTYNGDEVERRFNELRPNFPHIIFTSNGNDAFDQVDNPNIIYEKEMVTDENLIDKFSKTIIKNIENYRNYILQRKDKIVNLLEKGEKEGLDAGEKHDLLELQDELNALDKKNKNEVPKQLLTDEKLEDISKSKKEAEAYLESLIIKRTKK